MIRQNFEMQSSSGQFTKRVTHIKRAVLTESWQATIVVCTARWAHADQAISPIWKIGRNTKITQSRYIPKFFRKKIS